MQLQQAIVHSTYWQQFGAFDTSLKRSNFVKIWTGSYCTCTINYWYLAFFQILNAFVKFKCLSKFELAALLNFHYPLSNTISTDCKMYLTSAVFILFWVAVAIFHLSAVHMFVLFWSAGRVFVLFGLQPEFLSFFGRQPQVWLNFNKVGILVLSQSGGGIPDKIAID